jgi:hypothetical protein
MLAPATVDDLNLLYPQYSFVREGGSIYCYDDNNSIINIAQCGPTDYFSFHSMFDKIEPEHFTTVHTAVKQLLSTYLFFAYFFIDNKYRKIFLYNIRNSYFCRNYCVISYVPKIYNKVLYWSPEIEMGNNVFFLHLTNYNAINELNITLHTPDGQLINLPVTIDDIHNEHSKIVKFFFESMFKPYLGIEIGDFTQDHLKLLNMVII